MTGKVTFLVDCASFQGVPDWARVAAVCRGGAEKVTEGAGSTAYVNPRWATAKPAMQAVARHGFVPLAYVFLDAVESGGAQAQWFAQHAGDLSGWGIVIDFERAPNGSPTRQQAAGCAAELRKLYPRHPVGGYAPHWYTGGMDLKFVDWLWASSYVIGSGDPAMLYNRVPATWWAPYGNRHILLLQFTDQGSVAGISGAVDCSAFHGDEQQLATYVLPAAPKPKPRPAAKDGDDEMIILLPPGQPPVSFPVWAHAAATHEPAAYSNCSLVLAGGPGAVVRVLVYSGAGSPESFTKTLEPGQAQVIVPKNGWHKAGVVEVQRLDTKQAVGATAVFRTW